MRGVVMLPVSVHWPVDPLYSSALARKPSAFSPPAMSTCPLGSSVAVWPALAVFRLPVTVQVAEACATAGEAVTARRLIACLLYTSDAADDLLCVDLGGRRII